MLLYEHYDYYYYHGKRLRRLNTNQRSNNGRGYTKTLFSREAHLSSMAHTLASTISNYHTPTLTLIRQQAAETKAHKPSSPTTAPMYLKATLTKPPEWSVSSRWQA
jgi:hypothetical protein